jgi:hypothetical protein
MQDPHRLFPTMAHLGQMLDTHALEQNDWGDEREVWETAPPPEGDTIVGEDLPAQGCSPERRAGPGRRWPHVAARET